MDDLLTEVRKIPSYPKVYALGHYAIADLFQGPVLVEEKVDGSQFSFAKLHGRLVMRSKGAEVYNEDLGGSLGEGNGMFKPAVEYVESVKHLIPEGLIYRAEFLAKPKHNTLCYGAVPKNGLVLFDIERASDYTFFSPEGRAQGAEALGIDAIPFHGELEVHDPERIRELMDQESFLGGCKIEGLVFKNHRIFGRDGKFLAGKFVSESFKEVHGKEWKRSNPSGKDIRESLAERYCAEGRWAKAVQHLRERGELEGSPRDIGPLLKEIAIDLRTEEEEAIKEALFKWAFPTIQRGSTRGFAEWYKNRLMESQFDG